MGERERRETMSQTLTSLLVHIVFSTKNRADVIRPDVEPRLYAYVAGTWNTLGCRCLAAGGTSNHIHLLVSLSKTIALSEALCEVKKSSSKWIKTHTLIPAFQWQAGYGAFSIGQSNVDVVRRYIARQKEKHRRISFEDEFREMLQKYEIDYDDAYLWD
jgi:putative transposase